MSTGKSKSSGDEKNIHAGHRERVREKFRQSEFKGFNDHEVLELLLFYAIQRKDTNELAHKLINACGSLSAVLEAPIEFLVENGLTEQAALYIKVIFCTTKRYLEDKFSTETHLFNKDLLRKKLVTSFLGLDTEKVILVLFDTRGRELFYGVISEGVFYSAGLNIRKVAEFALKYHAASAIIAHNHPSGIAYPSDKDIEVTVTLRDTLMKVGVTLIDHYIVASTVINSFTSDPSLMEVFL